MNFLGICRECTGNIVFTPTSFYSVLSSFTAGIHRFSHYTIRVDSLHQVHPHGCYPNILEVRAQLEYDEKSECLFWAVSPDIPKPNPLSEKLTDSKVFSIIAEIYQLSTELKPKTNQVPSVLPPSLTVNYPLP